MELPREVLVGHDTLDNVGGACKRLKMEGPALIIADSNTKKIAGEAVIESLQQHNYEVLVTTIEDATIEEVERVKVKIEDDKINLVLGVGGGRPIDVAKLSSFHKEVPFISVPTAASHDGIVSSRASIWVDDRKKSYDGHTPFALIADTAIIAQAPKRINAAGCGDLISNETAVLDWELAHKEKNEDISTYAKTLSKMTAFVIEKYAEIISAGGEEGAWHVIKALVASGVAMSIAGSSRPCSGAEHMFSHKLDAIAPKPALHGEQCAIGTIMMMKLHGGDWEALKKTLVTIGTPTTAQEIGIGSEFIIQSLMEAHTIRVDRYTILGSGLTKGVATELAESTGVI
ncbi:MAG: NAD(P)-dependent glycerol-1-phosphate dehydrogenase [Thermoplasmata archaeon]|nr:MAG: NAD(P)-dependent glycerol-1-phosphate dehydrogenase [Thermoplasmata archaeon]